jgi:dienelactone hydrolase
MSVTKACCTLPPVACDYKEIGKYTQVNDFKVYESCSEEFKGTLIVIYDIFGFHNATNQFVDNIASKTNLRVLVPDLFKGNPFKPEDFPPKE